MGRDVRGNVAGKEKMMMRRFAGALVVAGALMVPLASPALAAPPSCEPGAPGCKTVEGPGKNQAGVRTTTNTQTQGNTTNKSPADQQGLQDTQSCNPPKSQGAPCP